MQTILMLLSDKLVQTILSVIVILVCLTSLTVCRRSGGLEIDKGLHETIGRVLAEETVKTLSSGDGLVLAVPVCAKTRLGAVEAQVAAFEKTLRVLGKGHIVGRETITAPTPQLDDLFTADTYSRLVQKYSNANAVVCFAGIKPFSESDLKDAAGKPPICVISMSGPVQADLIGGGIVGVALLPSQWAQGGNSSESTTQSPAFNNSYRIVKP